MLASAKLAAGLICTASVDDDVPCADMVHKLRDTLCTSTIICLHACFVQPSSTFQKPRPSNLHKKAFDNQHDCDSLCPS